MPRKVIPAEALVDLRRRLSTLPPRSHDRRRIIHETAALYGVSTPTLYRALQHQGKPHTVRRADYGTPRILPHAALERYCELIAVLKLRYGQQR